MCAFALAFAKVLKHVELFGVEYFAYEKKCSILLMLGTGRSGERILPRTQKGNLMFFKDQLSEKKKKAIAYRLLWHSWRCLLSLTEHAVLPLYSICKVNFCLLLNNEISILA